MSERNSVFVLGEKVTVDVDILLESRLLIQANSGAGKSWALRRVLEQSHGVTQQIVLDVEDEFGTLREKFDYVLAAPHGDCAVTVQSSALLARRLLEHRVSAIVSLYELKAHERVTFVRRFLDSMISAPKELWHPCMVVIDEAHLFCPQTGSAESSSAVIDLMTRGRKRGFCGVLATQRISKLHKDAAAEANNKLIGRSALDVDMKRAADELGFSRERQRELRALGAGEFFVFGPAITGGAVEKVTVGPVQTSHPKIGALRAEPRPPSAKVKAILAKLGDLPQAAAEEAQTFEALRGRIRDLERQIKERPAPAQDTEELRRKVLTEQARADSAESLLVKNKVGISALRRQLAPKADALREIAKSLSDAITALMEVENRTERLPLPKIATSKSVPSGTAVMAVDGASAQRVQSVALVQFKPDGLVATMASSELRGGALRMLQTLAQHYPAKLTKAQWGTVADMKHTGGSFSTYLSKLATGGYVERHGDLFIATEDGLRRVGQERKAPPAPGLDRVEFWATAVGGRPGDMLRKIAARYPQSIAKNELAAEVDMTASGGSFSTYLSKLRSNELIYSGRGDGEIYLSKWLMEN